MLLKFIFTAAFGLLFVSANFAQKQKENYLEIFSRDYQRAIKYLQTEKGIDSIIRSHGFNPKEVIATIFPELVRYNSIQDKIETFALETLYIQYGKDYANFRLANFKLSLLLLKKLKLIF